MVMIMLIKTHYQLKDSCKTMHWGKKDTCVWVFSQCVCGGLSMPSYALCPLIHHSPETGLHSNEATRADTHTHKHTHTHTHTRTHAHTHTHTHPVWTSSTVPLVDSNLKPPKKFSGKYTDEDQVVLFICDWGRPEACLISSRVMKAYGCGFSNSTRAHNKSLEEASVLGNVSYTGARVPCI